MGDFFKKVFGAIAAEIGVFAISAVIVGAIYYYVLSMPRAPDNPVLMADYIFLVLFALFSGAFFAVLRQRQKGPATCKVAGGVGMLAGLWAMSCPFCSLFILVWFGVPAGAGTLAFPFLEQYMDIIRVLALGVMLYGMKLALE